MSDTFHAPISEQIWDMKYRHKTADGQPLDKTVKDTWFRVASALAEAEEGEKVQLWRERFYDAMVDFKFLPAGRIIAGAGTGRRVTLFNCFVMGTIPDSMDGIFSHLREAALTMQQGGGIGYDFSTLRPKGALVKGVAADASGPLTFMDVWDAMCRTVMSAGSRRGAMMATMRCDHPDIEEFITAKQDSARLRMFNLSVQVTDAFMDAVKNDTDWDLIYPGPVATEQRATTALKPKGVTVYSTVRARDLWDKIMRSTYDAAEPGVLFIDRINAANNLNYVENIASSNPCGEQPLPPYGACLLGSINLAALVENAFTDRAGIDQIELGKLVAVAVRMMDNVVDVSNYPLPQQAEEAKNKRRIGLGVTGLADALAMCQLRYGSEEAAERAEAWMKLINEAAYRASCDLANEKGAFPLWDEKLLAEGTHASGLPSSLKDNIRKYGLRNALVTSIAPTGTISLYSGNVSSGIEPIFANSYTRKVLQKDGTKTEEEVVDYAVAAYRALWNDQFSDYDPEVPDWDDTRLPDYFVSAQTLAPLDHVRMQAAVQRHVDSSISKTINCPEDISFEDFKEVYMAAWDSGCKGCTTYRPNDVTGSVLSVSGQSESKPDDPRRWIGEDELLDAAQAWLGDPDPGYEGRKRLLKDVLNKMGLERVSQAQSNDQCYELMDLFDPELDGNDFDDRIAEMVAAPDPIPHLEPVAEINYLPAEEAPSKRPEALEGTTYKLKFGADAHAIYVTITDIEEHGHLRPFEIFINSKNMEHFAWTVALTRMISAVFRRPHDSTFVVEELKAVFDPRGGAWMEGKYVPSVLAAIGGIIEKHMQSIGYMDGTGQITEPGDATDFGITQEPPDGINAFQPRTVPFLCPKCHSSNCKKESGCWACLDCGHSTCG